MCGAEWIPVQMCSMAHGWKHLLDLLGYRQAMGRQGFFVARSTAAKKLGHQVWMRSIQIQWLEYIETFLY
jgi:hypothetical protein